MQITLNQAEIELAIREFVNKRVAISEEINVEIDLKATRGDSGFTANIDLIDSSSPTATSSAEVRPLKVTEKSNSVGRSGINLSKATPNAPVQEAEQDAAGALESSTATTAAPDVPDAAADASGEAEATGDGEQEGDGTPPPADKPRSLFANLSKPRNTN